MHHFSLTDDLLTTATRAELEPTSVAMAECGLWHLPYDRVLVSANLGALFSAPALGDDSYVANFPRKQEAAEVTVYYELINHMTRDYPCEVGNMVWLTHANGKSGSFYCSSLEPRLQKAYKRIAEYCGIVLIVALASQNVVVSTAINKRAARGIGNGKFRGPNGLIYLSTTHIKPPDPSPGNGGGTSPRVHFRRGHIHTFLTGKGRTTPIKKFIQPIFVKGRDPASAVPQSYVV